MALANSHTHHINGKCHHEEAESFIAPDDHRKKTLPRSVLKARCTARHWHAIYKRRGKKRKKKTKKKKTALDQNVRAMIHLFRHQYLQFHHVCTARRGNSLPWLHPMAHRAFFPRPAAPSQYACVCSPTRSSPVRRVNHDGRLWHRFTVRVPYPAWRLRKPDWTSCVMSVYIRERERSAEIKGHHVVFGEGIQAQNVLIVRAAILTRQ